MKTMVFFGEYLRRLRKDRAITLRSFCSEVGVGHANYSKMERGLIPPPKSRAKLEPIRKVLCLEPEGSEWKELVRLASLGRGEIPYRVLTDRDLAGKLPALFRSLEGEELDDKVLDDLVAAIRRQPVV